MENFITPEQLIQKAKKVEEKIKVKKEFHEVMESVRLNFGLVLGFILYIFTLGLVFGFIEYSVLGIVRLNKKFKNTKPKKEIDNSVTKKDEVIPMIVEK